MTSSRAGRCAVAAATLSLVAARPASARPVEGIVYGSDVAIASLVGDSGLGFDLGSTVTPSVGYELGSGFAPMLFVSYSRWRANLGTQSQLAAQAGLRWTAPWWRWRPSAELALGYGRLFYPAGLGGEMGLRSSAGLGLDVAFSDIVRAGVHVRFERLDGHDSHLGTLWLECGLAMTVVMN